MLKTQAFSLTTTQKLFDELVVALATLPRPPARGYSVRQPGEEVDERVCRILFDFLLPPGVLRSIPARKRRNAWTKALQSSLQGPCATENSGGLLIRWGLEPRAHAIFRSYWVFEWAVLRWNRTYFMIGTGINGLTSVEGNNTDLKSQNTVTEWTAWDFLWPSLVLRCLVSRFVFSCVVTPSDLFEGYVENSMPALVVSLLWYS